MFESSVAFGENSREIVVIPLDIAVKLITPKSPLLPLNPSFAGETTPEALNMPFLESIFTSGYSSKAYPLIKAALDASSITGSYFKTKSTPEVR